MIRGQGTGRGVGGGDPTPPKSKIYIVEVQKICKITIFFYYRTPLSQNHSLAPEDDDAMLNT